MLQKPVSAAAVVVKEERTETKPTLTSLQQSNVGQGALYYQYDKMARCNLETIVAAIRHLEGGMEPYEIPPSSSAASSTAATSFASRPSDHDLTATIQTVVDSSSNGWSLAKSTGAPQFYQAVQRPYVVVNNS